MKEAIITIIQDAEMTDEQGHPFSETLVYRVEFEGDFLDEVNPMAGDHIAAFTKVVACEQLGSTQNVTAKEVLGKR